MFFSSAPDPVGAVPTPNAPTSNLTEGTGAFSSLRNSSSWTDFCRWVEMFSNG